MALWPEVSKTIAEKRCELVLTGTEVSEKIKNGFDERMFTISSLNFLDISNTSLAVLSDQIGNLTNLNNLVLRGNQLTTVPSSIGKLRKLKMLDFSRNQLEDFPVDCSGLGELQSLNLSCNNLSELPGISGMVQLHFLEISHNKLVSLPDGISNPKLTLLQKIEAHHNEIEELPTDLHELPSLKVLDVTDNKLTMIPSEMSECGKLKEFKYGGNKLKDRRLAKMMGQHPTRAILAYLASGHDEGKRGGKGKVEKKRKGKGGQVTEDEVVNLMKVLKFDDDSGMRVKMSEAVTQVRPYILCCVVNNLNLNRTVDTFKKFIAVQTQLHDTVCGKRQKATIATHDLTTLHSPLSYDAWLPTNIKITPLYKKKECTADQLLDQLRKEADDRRKEKKRSTVSGVHKYLDLLRGKTHYPCLVDGGGTVISLPPITNCDSTKVTVDTRCILVEITSTINLDVCKQIMEELLQKMLELGLGENPGKSQGDPAEVNPSGAEAKPGHFLSLGQVKVEDSQGRLKVIYPSKVDLQSPAFRVER